ncbi:MAG: 30S ribosomal protein S20 [Spirochaetales bacterium]|nr:30S ribosomal protein S20 [Spirochaetales bacterium]
MAINRSAIKRQKQSEKQRLRNKMIKSRIRSCIRKAREAAAVNNSEAASKIFEEFRGLIDRAVSKGIYHLNNAARKKSRMYAMVKKIAQTPQEK